eukprot:TRINITY_DN2451_c0_g1_i6.p1 TRINITY_DN2451_c0_g1~~TRINITY_DN2451_c0_g1_i6.p1  ORF type:complete len:214 (+),score=47.89 TRINITY_DN2451_c0_g1_i6:112-753(+)
MFARAACIALLLGVVCGRPLPVKKSSYLKGRQATGTVLLQHVLSSGETEKPPPPFRSDGEIRFFGSGGEEEVSANVEVPKTFSTFMEGLMWRKEMSDDQAMLFRWSEDGRRAFWMENTYVPLDIIFANSAKEIVSIKPAQPLDVSSVAADAPAQYAIEVPQGWCQKKGVKVGDTVRWSSEIDLGSSFVARDLMNFGASHAEVEAAVSDGNYQP